MVLWFAMFVVLLVILCLDFGVWVTVSQNFCYFGFWEFSLSRCGFTGLVDFVI